jgi:hypothetical protein
MVFDSTQGYTQAKLCAQTETIQPEAGETVRAHAALCAAEQPLTGVNGRVSDVTGPDDPKFGRFIAQMTTNLLPPTNPDRRGGDHGIFF